MKHLQTLGSDPEFFLKGGKDGHIPGCGLVGANKESPLRIVNGAILEDNVMVEINPDPASTPMEFFRNLTTCMEQAQEIVGHELSQQSHVEFDQGVLDTHTGALEVGCDPSVNAYTETLNDRVSALDLGVHRYAGGHLHLGFDDDLYDPVEVVKYLDIFLGLPAITEDQGVKRRELYGKFGEFRSKHYGVEYRVLSNYWCFNDESFAETLWSRAEKALELASSVPYEEYVKENNLTEGIKQWR